MAVHSGRKVLVGYATDHGSTKGVADRIAARLGELGSDTDLRALDQSVDARGYDAAILGSALHNQAWLPAAAGFVDRSARVLVDMPVWLFSVGMPGALGRPWRTMALKEEPKQLAAWRACMIPCDHHLFTGVIRRDHVPLFGRLLFRLAGGRYGDFRDWVEIDEWAGRIAKDLSR